MNGKIGRIVVDFENKEVSVWYKDGYVQKVQGLSLIQFAKLYEEVQRTFVLYKIFKTKHILQERM